MVKRKSLKKDFDRELFDQLWVKRNPLVKYDVRDRLTPAGSVPTYVIDIIGIIKDYYA